MNFPNLLCFKFWQPILLKKKKKLQYMLCPDLGMFEPSGN